MVKQGKSEGIQHIDGQWNSSGQMTPADHKTMCQHLHDHTDAAPHSHRREVCARWVGKWHMAQQVDAMLTMCQGASTPINTQTHTTGTPAPLMRG